MSETQKDAVLRYGLDGYGSSWRWFIAENPYGDYVKYTDYMALHEEATQLRAILAALREPSAHVIEWEDPAFPLTVADQEILAAVEAAEKEVDG